MKNLLILILFVLPMALFSASPSCGAGISVSIIDAKGKVIKTGKLNKQGMLTLSGIDEAVWDVKLSNNGKSIVLDVNKKKKRIDKSSPLIFKAKISDYQDGDDLILRKRPGRSQGHIGKGSSGQSRTKGETTLGDISVANRASANVNTSRSNKKSGIVDEDDDGDGIDTEMAHDGMDQDCDGADISVTSKVDKFGVSSITIMIRNK